MTEEFVYVRYIVDEQMAASRCQAGWNRLHFVVDDIAADTERLRAAGVEFRNEIIRGPTGRAPEKTRPPICIPGITLF